jgi:hypothetical protein
MGSEDSAMLTVVVAEQEHPLESVVEADIREFESWFQAQGNDPLVRSEVAILKTYLWWKTKGVGDVTQAGG